MREHENVTRMAEPEDVLLALTQKVINFGKTTQTHDAVHRTAVAVGLAIEWTEVNCERHGGKRAPFHLEAKYNLLAPLRLRDCGIRRPDVQSVITSMTSEVARADVREPLRREFLCSLCLEDGKDPPQTVQTVALADDGPSHFLAQVPKERDNSSESDREHDEVEGVSPSFQLRAFGRSYMLCAVVYWQPRGHHFVSQVYLPSARVWKTYDDLDGGSTQGGPHFDEAFHKGAEHMFLYVSNSTVEKAGCLVRSVDTSLEEENGVGQVETKHARTGTKVCRTHTPGRVSIRP